MSTEQRQWDDSHWTVGMEVRDGTLIGEIIAVDEHDETAHLKLDTGDVVLNTDVEVR